jgi:hypothetical protein
MTFAYAPTKQFVFVALTEAGKFVKEHVGVTGKATPDEVSVTFKLRRRRR